MSASKAMYEHETRSQSSTSIPAKPEPLGARAKRYGRVTLHHFKNHTGLGVVCSVAYFDPGNWSVDLEGGSQFGYKLLFVVLVSGIFAAIFQAMATRMGCVTGLDLAQHCRMLLYDRPKHKKLIRWGVLYPLYAVSEIAIVSTDLAELLGSATALVMLFPSLPLWAGVLITAMDVFLILGVCNPTKGKPVKLFEGLITGLVVAVFVCLIIVIVQVSPNWGQTFLGFVPSKTLGQSGAIYTSIGIIGATVMPHGLFLGSALSTQDRVGTKNPAIDVSDKVLSEALPPTRTLRDHVRRFLSGEFVKSAFSTHRVSDDDPIHGEHSYNTWSNNTYAFIKEHMYHSIVDVVMSLLGFAVMINCMILILASAVFFYQSGGNGDDVPADLFEAHDLIKVRVGKPAAILFALALLAAGESAGITATLAGQIVSEGFIRWHIAPVLRRAITRLFGLLPAMLVAVIVGRNGLNSLLVASQVVLSFALPFVVFPLVWVTSKREYMLVKVPKHRHHHRNAIQSKIASSDSDSDFNYAHGGVPPPRVVTDDGALTVAVAELPRVAETAEGTDEEDEKSYAKALADPEKADEFDYIDYSNGKIMMISGYVIWVIVVLANGYVIISLAMGNSG